MIKIILESDFKAVKLNHESTTTGCLDFHSYLASILIVQLASYSPVILSPSISTILFSISVVYRSSTCPSHVLRFIHTAPMATGGGTTTPFRSTTLFRRTPAGRGLFGQFLENKFSKLKKM